MAKRLTVEDHLTLLKSLRACPSAPETLAELRKALANKVILIVQRAADLTAEFKLADLGADLVAAFDRFMADGSDKGCSAKTATAKALYELGSRADGVGEVFLRGIKHVQKEGSFGPPVDVAAELRAVCALGLVRIGQRGAMIELADLLADPEPQARIGAVRAIAYAGHDQGVPLLRFKVLSGDIEPDVLAECFHALFSIAPRASLPLIARFLHSGDDQVRDNAALAMGESKLPEAFTLLREQWQRSIEPAFRRPLLLAMALTRVPDAVQLLLSIIATDRPPVAADAIEALRIYRHDDAIRAKVKDAVDARNLDLLRARFADAFER